MTAAMLRTCIWVGSTVTPMRFEHIREGLRGEQRQLLVAGAVQADHDAVADQLVVAHAFDGDQLFEAAGSAARFAVSASVAMSGDAAR